MTDAISAAEHANRRARLSEHVRTLGAAGYVVCDPTCHSELMAQYEDLSVGRSANGQRASGQLAWVFGLHKQLPRRSGGRNLL